MALGDGEDGAAKNFGGVGAEADAQGDGAGGERAQFEAVDAQQVGQVAHQLHGAEIDQQHPEQFGDAAHDGRIGTAQPLQRLVRGSLG
ncbi:hypothetical protein D9M68_912840 [compost metagenome]